jgi:hypothetical protein
MNAMPKTARRRAAARPPLLSRATVGQLRLLSRSQWRIAAVVSAVALVVIGTVGQTLPWSSSDRVYKIEWWNWATLLASALLLGLIAATFVTPGRRRVRSAAGSGVAGTAAAIALACPVCSPLAVPLLGAGGALAFLRGDRAWIALASVLILGLTLLMRLRASTTCTVRTGADAAHRPSLRRR